MRAECILSPHTPFRTAHCVRLRMYCHLRGQDALALRLNSLSLGMTSEMSMQLLLMLAGAIDLCRQDALALRLKSLSLGMISLG